MDKKKLLFLIMWFYFSFFYQSQLFAHQLSLIEKGLCRFPLNLALKNQVTEILLSNNEIKKIPRKINLLKNLTGLCLCRNQITTLPEEICELDNLQYLCLENNPLKSFPFCVTSMTCEIILTFDESQEMNEIYALLLLRKNGLTTVVQKVKKRSYRNTSENEKITFIKNGLLNEEFKKQHTNFCNSIEERAKVITAQSKRKSSCNAVVTTSSELKPQIDD